MARFVFKLQTLLDRRVREEDEVRRALAVLTQRKSAIENRLRRHQEELVDGRETMRGRLVGTVDMNSLRMYAHSALGVMRSAQNAAIELAGLGKRIDQVREQLIAARKNRRTVELLRERRHMEWRREQERREVAVLDDLVSSAHAKKEFIT